MSLDFLIDRMSWIVQNEKRAFSYRDFISFDHDGTSYNFEHETIRNYLSNLRKLGKIKIVYAAKSPSGASVESFYTLTNFNEDKSISRFYTGIYPSSYSPLNHHQIRYLDHLLHIPIKVYGIHDVELHFEARGLWEVVKMYPQNLAKNVEMTNNKAITLDDIHFLDHVIHTKVYKNDRVIVHIACLHNYPIPLDPLGLAKLSGSLTRVEERLQNAVNKYLKENLRSLFTSDSLIEKESIPNCMTWIAKMWLFGRDFRTFHRVDMFDISWEESLRVFYILSNKFMYKKGSHNKRTFRHKQINPGMKYQRKNEISFGK